MKGINRLVMAAVMVIGLHVNTIPARASNGSWGWLVYSPDKTMFAYWEVRSNGNADLMVNWLASDGKTSRAWSVVDTDINFIGEPVWSPDSKSIAYLIRNQGLKVAMYTGSKWQYGYQYGNITEVSSWTKKGISLVYGFPEKNEYWFGVVAPVGDYSTPHFPGTDFLYTSSSWMTGVEMSPNGYYASVYDPAMSAVVIVPTDTAGYNPYSTKPPVRYLWGCRRGNWSPDGSRFACIMSTGNMKVYNLTKGEETLLQIPSSGAAVEWSDDGSKVVWANGSNIYWSNFSSTYQIVTGGIVLDPHIRGKNLVYTSCDHSGKQCQFVSTPIQ